MLKKIRECVKCCCQAFLLNEPASLDKMPFTVFRKLTLAKWKFIKRNAGADDVDLVFIATEFNHRATQRSRTDENSRHDVEHSFGRIAISRFIHVDQNVGTVKRNDAWFRPRPNQRQKMNGNMSEKNMQKLRVLAIHNVS